MASIGTRQAAKLYDGQRLDQPSFHRLYDELSREHPALRAELVEGVVHLKMPISDAHGDPHALLGTWVGFYRAMIPGVAHSVTPTLILGTRTEPEPDLVVRRLPEFGGRCRRNQREILVGPPELVVEVSRTVDLDLGGKFRDYQAAGVGEYLVHPVEDGAVRWWSRGRPDRPFEEQHAIDGVLRSRTFPGLWLDLPALHAGDAAALLATLQQGLAGRPA